MNTSPAEAPLKLSVVDEIVDFATVTMSSVFCGHSYMRGSTLPKLLHVPELWLMPGDNTRITETILADLEGLLQAQASHLHRGRIDLFDPARFWALVEACRGEKLIFMSQFKRLSDRAAKRQPANDPDDAA